ncbi:hypothetical protein [Actinomadura nitritigenes]|uniref:hypothetical protein n=1 Tax=Actinomadura nitritigenes TaxID=134602 RepID=UPI003D91CD10
MSAIDPMGRDLRVLIAVAMGAPVCLAELPDGQPCLSEATARVQIGCVHEHVTVQPVCDPCAEVACSGEATCRYCEYGEDSHVCALVGRRVS